MLAAAAVSHPWMQVALATGLLLPLQGAAQAPQLNRGASTGFSVSLTVRPKFQILESRPVAGGHEYKVWTNMRLVQLNGREYRFERVGEAIVVVPGPLVEMPAERAMQTVPATQAVPAQQGS